MGKKLVVVLGKNAVEFGTEKYEYFGCNVLGEARAWPLHAQLMEKCSVIKAITNEPKLVDP